MVKTPFVGPWRIVWMSDWDQDCVDMVVPGHINFDARQSGNFQFGMVQGQMDCKLDERQGPRVEFTWQGFDEGDELSGRGHAEIMNGELHGHLYIHFGEDSAFRAVMQPAAARKPARKGKIG
jgi:hypothetical protein